MFGDVFSALFMNFLFSSWGGDGGGGGVGGVLTLSNLNS